MRPPAIGRGGLNDQLVPPLRPRRTTASRLHSTLSVCDPRIINCLPRFAARFSSPDSYRSNLATSTFTERYVNILIALFQYDWRPYRLHAREAQVWPPPSVSYFSQPAATEAAAQWCLRLLQASVRVACAGG